MSVNNNIQVKIINPEVLTNLYKNHGEFACKCYDTPVEYADKVGKSCQKDGHMSGSRCEYIKFEISNLDRGTAEQSLRHEIGTDVPFEIMDNYSFSDYSELVKDVSPDQIVKNMASFRYIDKNGFDWTVPRAIEKCEEANSLYNDLMEYINQERFKIKDAMEKNGVDAKVANEAVNFVLPRATTTSFVIGFTPEALIHFCHKRLCTRAQEFIRQLATKMRDACAEYNPTFTKELVPQCEHLLWCPEGKRCCGLRKTKQELMEQLNNKEKKESKEQREKDDKFEQQKIDISQIINP